MIGVLALQGDVREHLRALEHLGEPARPVLEPADLAGVKGLVLPGGESTTLSLLLASSGLLGPVGDVLDAGTAVFGTCAGMILLAGKVSDGRPDQAHFGGIDLEVRRNGFGSQAASFECDLEVDALGPPSLHAVFIRAPLVERAGAGVDVLARLPTGLSGSVVGPGSPVLCRQGSVLVSSFHPELTTDTRVHRYFVEMAKGA
ncbi:MAG: pyridoxal 5'-phosphate synthase glutaminase subunit PdxT [Acidimicrobiales bacterium]